MSNNDALFPSVQEFIEFEALLLQARKALDDYANQSWSNTDEHDPGITLLEAMCYNTSDLAYRSSLPLTDLLTPAPQDQQSGEGIFPVIFGPQQALTCGPISEEDYRRALLDLRCTGPQGGYFCFSNVYLVKEPEDQRYTYWYDKKWREYSFIRINEIDSVEMTLLGNYHLYLQPSRETETDNHQAAQITLEAYLREHRNLGEAVSRIIWLEPEAIMVNADIELDDNVDASTSVARILAAIYTVIEQYITPPIIRCSTEELLAQGWNNEEIYQGPYLQHGWIPELPPALDISQPVSINLVRLVNILLGIDGVKKIQALGTGPADDSWKWTATTAANYPLLWGADPIEVLAQGGVIRLMLNGVERTASASAIRAELPAVPLRYNPVVTLPYGRWRNPSDYHPFTNQIPPCYGLSHLPATPEQVQLHQCILPFEQLLANGCQQLALLPNLLAFNRDINDVVWGEKWPFSPLSVSNAIFREYSQGIKAFLSASSRSVEKELSYIDYLLRYFNSQVAPRTLTFDVSYFTASQQGYLSKITQLTYNRANIRIDKVSALQQRIAAHLGIGGAEIFNADAPLDKLPFYIVEHRALLPVFPDPFYNDEQPIQRLYQEAGYLIVELAPSSTAPLRDGQLVDLILTANGSDLLIRAVMVARFNSDEPRSFALQIASNAQLQRNLERLLDEANSVSWKNCQVWMEDMEYPLVYAEDQGGESNRKWLTSSPQSAYPAMVREGDILRIEHRIAPDAFEEPTFMLEAKVVKADNVANILIVEKIDGANDFPPEGATQGYFWYFTGDQAITDRFSFVVSVVFDRELIDELSTDVAAVNAWVQDTVLQEFPSHISMLMHWMPHDQFENFAYTYNTWQRSGGSLGDASFSLLRMLTLGCMPSSLTGIGAMHIATPEQKTQVVGPDEDQWNSSIIERDELFYVPPASSGEPDSE